MVQQQLTIITAFLVVAIAAAAGRVITGSNVVVDNHITVLSEHAGERDVGLEKPPWVRRI